VVCWGAAVEVVCSGAAVEVVCSGAAVEVVGSGAAVEVVGSGAAVEVVGSGAAVEVVGLTSRRVARGPSSAKDSRKGRETSFSVLVSFNFTGNAWISHGVNASDSAKTSKDMMIEQAMPFGFILGIRLLTRERGRLGIANLLHKHQSAFLTAFFESQTYYTKFTLHVLVRRFT
jgi:hypothetical protein